MYVVMYSKFSPASQRFLALIENLTTVRFHLVCVDNRSVRERVTQRKSRLSIEQVPCIVRVFADTGYTELFEGEKAFELIKSMMQDQEKVTAPSIPVATSPVVQPPPAVSPKATPLHQLPELEEVMSSKLPPSSSPVMTIQQHLQSTDRANTISDPLPVSISKAPTTTLTPIEELLGSSDNNKAYLSEIEKESKQRGVPERALKNTQGSGGNIVLRAQQMQKEREQEMSSNPAAAAAMRM